MRRFFLSVLICFGMLSLVIAADTPGEVAVKDAIKTLKEKRAAVKDKADQALLDTAIKDLEERLAQVGKGEPEPEVKKDDGPFVMPKNWELKFNTGKARPSYNAKTGELKLVYNFADAKQLKDFEFDKDFKPLVQKGILSVKGGEQIRHVVKFNSISVSVSVAVGNDCDAVETSTGFRLQFVTANNPSGFQFYQGDKCLVFDVVTTGDLRRRPVLVKDFIVTDKKCGVTLDGKGVASAITSGTAGHLVFKAKQADSSYSKLTITGTLDSEWAKEFFAD